MDNKELTPKIRFAGFTDPWEQRKLRDVAEFNPRSELPDEFEYVDLESVVGTEMVSHRTEKKETAPSRAQRLAQSGDVFFQTVRPYQRNNYLFVKPDKNYVFSTGYAQMRPIIDASFLMCFLQTDSFVNVVLDNCTGTSYPAINSNDLSNLSIILPTNQEEQMQIGRMITNLDNLITLHQRKYEKLQNIKKSMLEKMFPRDGSNIPEVRFAGFTDPWEQRKFSEFALRESAIQQSSDDYPSIEYEDVIAEEGRLNKDVQLKETQKPGIVFDGTQVLYGKLRPYLHNWLNPEFKGVAVGDWWVLRPVDIDKSFLYRLIQTQQFDQVANQSAGSKMPRADWNLVSNTTFNIPSSRVEQSHIATTFYDLDNLITLHQRKLEKLKNIKKSMLESMFV